MSLASTVIVIYVIFGFIFHNRITTLYKTKKKNWPMWVIHCQVIFWWLPIVIWNIKSYKNLTKNYQSKTDRYKPLFEEANNEKNT